MLLVVALAVALGGVSLLLAMTRLQPSWDPQSTAYVGRESCVRCHEPECKAWTGSDHDRAMDPATPEFVLGDFGDRQIEHFGVVSKMHRRGDDYFMTTDNRQGKVEQFRIKYVLGYRPLQQYLVEFPDGRIQCLPIAWDSVQNRWYHLYPNEPIPHHDPLHWTRSFQNWNYMCADCHTTNLKKNFSVAENEYRTTFSEMDVSCETCHGPAGTHVAWADSWRGFKGRSGYALAKLKDPDPNVEIASCAPCHAHRRIVYPGFRPGDRFTDFYFPALLDDDLYYADGQIKEEVYEYSSFIQSRMYHEKVRCSNCHDPHTMKVKFLDEQGLPDNKLCGQCHLPTKYDTVQHHHHPDLSKPGYRCVECHMPETTYMVVDPRRDHSIRIPRPDLTLSLGIPNACTGCHNDEAKGENAQWAEDLVQKWYGPRKTPQHFAHAIDAGRKLKPEGEELLVALLRRQDIRPIVRASAISLLSRYARGQGERWTVESEAVEGLKHESELVRVASVRAIDGLPKDAMLQDDYVKLLAPLLSDQVRSVRIEAARALSRVREDKFAEADQEARRKAIEEFLAGQEALSDQAGSHVNRGEVFNNIGDAQKAEEAYQTALRIDPDFFPAHHNLALLYDAQGKHDAAESQFRKEIEALGKQLASVENVVKTLEDKKAEKPGAAASASCPVGATAAGAAKAEEDAREMAAHLRLQQSGAYYSLGLLLGQEPKRLNDAIEALAMAVKLTPDNPRMHYNLAVALEKAGRLDEAEKEIVSALQLDSRNPDILNMLRYLQQRRQEKPAAGVARP